MTKIFFRVIGNDHHGLYIEDACDLFPDQLVDHIDIKFGGEFRLHAVDDLQLGAALGAFFQQTLGFIKETRIFNGNGGLVCEQLQQAQLGIGESTRVGEVNIHHTDHTVTEFERQTDQRPCPL